MNLLGGVLLVTSATEETSRLNDDAIKAIFRGIVFFIDLPPRIEHRQVMRRALQPLDEVGSSF